MELLGRNNCFQGPRGYDPLTASILTIPLAIGLATMHYDTPYWILAVWMFINSFGSGLFQPPNTSAIMYAMAI